MNGSRRQLLTVALFGGLIATLAACSLELLKSRAAAIEAAEGLQSCRRLAGQIESLRAAPAHASLRRQSLQDLALKIDQATQVANIPASALVRISPQASRRIGKTDHVEQPTSIEMRQITLEQLARFLVELSSSDAGLEVTSLRLSAPRMTPAEGSPETWSVELVLTYLMFSPEYAAHPS